MYPANPGVPQASFLSGSLDLLTIPGCSGFLERVQVVAFPKSEEGGPDALLHWGVEGILLLSRSPPEPWGFLS